MIRDRDADQMLTRPLGEASVRLVGDAAGLVVEISAGWRPRPGGWFYSEGNEVGIWVAGPPASV
jgi:hypothetical protein